MIERYSHLTDADTAAAVAELAGVTPPGEKKRSKALEPIQCPRCATINPPTNDFCGKCGLALTEEAAAEVDGISADVRKLMANDPALVIEAAQSLQRGIDEKKQHTVKGGDKCWSGGRVWSSP